jgi:PAS domain S-box-containing protein
MAKVPEWVLDAREAWMTGIEAEAALLGERVGSFRFLIAGERWEWSDEVARMHGYEPGSVVPTTELVLAHKHADDKPAVTALVDNMIRHGQPFSSRHRIIDTSGRVRVLVAVGNRLVDETGEVIGTAGFYIDITDSYEPDVQRRLGQVSKDIAVDRAVIERARGILMYVYNFSATDALSALKWRSQETGLSLRVFCEQFVREVVAANMTPDLVRREVDHVLLTAHERAGEPHSETT